MKSSSIRTNILVVILPGLRFRDVRHRGDTFPGSLCRVDSDRPRRRGHRRGTTRRWALEISSLEERVWLQRVWKLQGTKMRTAGLTLHAEAERLVDSTLAALKALHEARWLVGREQGQAFLLVQLALDVLHGQLGAAGRLSHAVARDARVRTCTQPRPGQPFKVIKGNSASSSYFISFLLMTADLPTYSITIRGFRQHSSEQFSQ